MYVLTIYLIQVQARGWTSTNDPKQVQMRANKHDQAAGTSTKHKQPQVSMSKSQTSMTRWQGQGEQRLPWEQASKGNAAVVMAATAGTAVVGQGWEQEHQQL